MESLEHLFASVVRVQFDIVAHGAGSKQAVYAPRRDEVLRNDDIQKSIGFSEDLARLRTLSLVLENARINTLQSPSMEERRPVNEVAQCRQRKVMQHADTGKRGSREVFGPPLDRSPSLARGLDGDDRLARRGMGLAERLVIRAMLRHERRLALVT